MKAFTRLDGCAAPLELANIDTDQIIPKQFLKTVEREGLAKGLFYDFRFDGDLRDHNAGVLKARSEPISGNQRRLGRVQVDNRRCSATQQLISIEQPNLQLCHQIGRSIGRDQEAFGLVERHRADTGLAPERQPGVRETLHGRRRRVVGHCNGRCRVHQLIAPRLSAADQRKIDINRRATPPVVFAHDRTHPLGIEARGIGLKVGN